jgi:hypothetical protein
MSQFIANHDLIGPATAKEPVIMPSTAELKRVELVLHRI